MFGAGEGEVGELGVWEIVLVGADVGESGEGYSDEGVYK